MGFYDRDMIKGSGAFLRGTNKAISAQPGHPPVADKVVVLDSHALRDNRISKHIGSVSASYPVLRLNFNFYADRKATSPDEQKVKSLNVGNLQNPYLNGMLFTVRNMLGYSKGIERTLRQEFLEKNDRVIFHVHDPYVLGLAHKLKRKFAGSHIVYDRHEYYDAWRNRLGFSSPGTLERMYGRSVDELVFVSRRLDSLPKNLRKKKVTVIPNYPQAGRFQGDEAKKKIEGFDSSDRIEFVYFGVLNLDFDRDMRMMFRIMDSLMGSNEKVCFTVAGRMDDRDVRSFLDDLEIKYGDRMSYLGEIPFDEVVTRTQRAHFGLFLLRTDSKMWSEDHPVSPNKIYEYLLSGTVPVVRAALDDLDIIAPSSLAFGKSSTFEEIRDDIAGLLADRPRMRRMMAECLALGRKFSWETVSQGYLECYARLFSATGGKSINN